MSAGWASTSPVAASDSPRPGSWLCWSPRRADKREGGEIRRHRLLIDECGRIRTFFRSISKKYARISSSVALGEGKREWPRGRCNAEKDHRTGAKWLSASPIRLYLECSWVQRILEEFKYQRAVSGEEGYVHANKNRIGGSQARAGLVSRLSR